VQKKISQARMWYSVCEFFVWRRAGHLEPSAEVAKGARLVDGGLVV